MSRRRLSAEEANKLLDEILEEDKLEKEDDDSSEICSGECAEEDPDDQKIEHESFRFCECIRIAEHSSRFSLRVMEAMRSLQEDDYDFLPTSSVEEIVDYIRENYRDDGDLYAQVRTALKQVCSQGFAMELLENEYHFVGPHAASMNQVTCSKGPRDCSRLPPTKIRKRRKQDKSKDICMCIEPADEKNVSKQRRVSRDGRVKKLGGARCANLEAVRDNREEDKLTEGTEDWTTSLTLTDEDVDPVIYEGGTHGRTRRALEHGDGREDGRQRTMETGGASNDPTKIPQQSDDDEPEANDQSNHQVSQKRIRSTKDKQREEELERWIERCRRDCERRKNQRKSNN